MGVNMAGNCIIDDEVCREASRQEIIRRYYKSCAAFVSGDGKEEEVRKIELLLKQAPRVSGRPQGRTGQPGD